MQKFQYTPAQKQALEAACEALVPALKGDGTNVEYWKSTAADFDVAGQILEMMDDQNLPEQKEFKQLLDLLEGKIASLIWAGSWAEFKALPVEKRAKILQKWMGSRFNVLRKAFGTLKKLTMFLHYGSHQKGHNPTWAAADYPGPLKSTAGNRVAIEALQFEEDTTLSCDVLIVGSGAGGGLAAGELAAKGKDVILLEKGPFMNGPDFNEHEAEMIRKTYDKQAAFQTTSGSVTVFAGSCLGGGTTINWTGAFKTPSYVLQEWSDEHGLSFATTPEFQKSFDRVMERSNVNTDHSPHNPQNAALWKGSEKLGEHVECIARNVEGCANDGNADSCGFCGMGCRRGNKRGTLPTYIQQAAKDGARIIANAAFQKLSFENSQVTGGDVLVKTENGKTINLKVKAKQVILAAGSIHTPAILMRSGVNHPGIGAQLFLHPTVGVTGVYDQRINPYLGVMMSAVNKQHMQLEGNYGYWIETPPLHPGVGALALPWESPAQHKRDLLQSGNMAAFIVLTRDKFGGRVKVDAKGNPIVDYTLNSFDRDHMLKGIRKAFEIHRAAGADKVIFPHAKRRVFNLKTNKVSHDAWLDRLPKWGWKANQAAIFTAHQMGTCPMGTDPNRHPVDLDGKVRGYEGLYVADGSLLPSAAGVNPMMSIMALADWVIHAMHE